MSEEDEGDVELTVEVEDGEDIEEAHCHDAADEMMDDEEEGEALDDPNDFSLRSKLWVESISRLRRSIDEIYALCEFESDEECVAHLVQLLGTAIHDFQALQDRVRLQVRCGAVWVTNTDRHVHTFIRTEQTKLLSLLLPALCVQESLQPGVASSPPSTSTRQRTVVSPTGASQFAIPPRMRQLLPTGPNGDAPNDPPSAALPAPTAIGVEHPNGGVSLAWTSRPMPATREVPNPVELGPALHRLQSCPLPDSPSAPGSVSPPRHPSGAPTPPRARHSGGKTNAHTAGEHAGVDDGSGEGKPAHAADDGVADVGLPPPPSLPLRPQSTDETTVPGGGDGNLFSPRPSIGSSSIGSGGATRDRLRRVVATVLNAHRKLTCRFASPEHSQVPANEGGEGDSLTHMLIMYVMWFSVRLHPS